MSFYASNRRVAASVLAALGLLTMHSTSSSHAAAAESSPSTTLAKATFGGGCFWCTEAVFESEPGVKSVTSGYAGGQVENPTYRQISGGDTGHAEVIQIEYNPDTVTFERLLDLFWDAHDPTTLNRQGADVGPQYRSIILTHDDAQRAAAEKSKATAQAKFDRPIVTEIVPLTKFYAAEKYHQDYFRNNREAPYCRAVITPKLKKLGRE